MSIIILSFFSGSSVELLEFPILELLISIWFHNQGLKLFTVLFYDYPLSAIN